jgi:hypothetical protein
VSLDRVRAVEVEAVVLGDETGLLWAVVGWGALEPEHRLQHDGLWLCLSSESAGAPGDPDDERLELPLRGLRRALELRCAWS